jgi:Tfp pilus assembly protein PilO
MASKPNLRSHRIVLVGGYAALAAGFLLAGAAPCVHGLRTARADIARDQAEIDARIARAGELEEVRSQLELIHVQTTDFQRLVPPDQDLGFLTELTEQLTASGMRDISFHNLAETPLVHSFRVPVEIHGKGAFPQFHDFMTRLENLRRLCSVNHMSIDANAALDGTVEVRLTLYYYYAKPNL